MRIVRLSSFAAVLGLLAIAALSFSPSDEAEADHPWEAHAYQFHWCQQITYAIQYTNRPFLDRVLYDTLDRGFGWDAHCGNKFLSWWWESLDTPTVYFEVNASWVVDYYCGVTWAWACAYPWGCYWEWEGGAAACGFTIFIKDWAFDRAPYFIVNHEVGHVLGLADHWGAGYTGIMNGNAIIYTQWPTWWEYAAVEWRMWNGP
jgi:hypothetical protein